MAAFGLTHAADTMVGNDFIRGISGGEKKRLSIAEAYANCPVSLHQHQHAHLLHSAIGGSPIQCWDNSTRGLDSATALECVRTLRTSAELSGTTAVVTLYQASQAIYDVSCHVPFQTQLANVPRLLTKSPCSTRVVRSILVMLLVLSPISLTWDSNTFHASPLPTF